ncbi:MAG: hypothetical protein NTW66_00520 [Candidatus Magasanikbacteria bacterium]|nr:hypothetical protein [Candidatus Magasanikbacteria bacterium]
MKKNSKQFSSLVKMEGSLWEMVYDQQEKTTAFVGLENGAIQIRQNIEETHPFPPGNGLLTSNTVLFPSKAESFGSEDKLIGDIRAFIHKYLEVGDFMEKVSPFYVLFTWTYDSFNELPYLRAIADYGCGKSRFLKVIGSVCYKPSFIGGATNAAPIFRIIDQFNGTLIIDEADLRFSDTTTEIVKILNNGFQSGMPVLRCANSEKNHEVEPYNVFGPKIVATRERYQDKALESRFIVEQMDGKLTRSDISKNISDEFSQEALAIRNKCLMWRLQNYGTKKLDISFNNLPVEPRLIQVIAPLLSIINDEATKNDLVEYIKKYNQELIIDRGLSFEAPILRTIMNLIANGEATITMDNIAKTYNYGLVKGEKELSARKVGQIVREKFGFRTERRNVGYVVDMASYEKNIARLCKKYDLDNEGVNFVNDTGVKEEGDLHQELKNLGLISDEEEIKKLPF